MKRETKTILLLAMGIILLQVGTSLLTPSYWIVGLILGILAMPLFVIGAYWAIKSFIKSIKQFQNKEK